MGQLIVVSNRVALPERSTTARAGGLEFAVDAALKQRSGIWFGWSGRIATHGTTAARRVVDKEITYITIDLSLTTVVAARRSSLAESSAQPSPTRCQSDYSDNAGHFNSLSDGVRCPHRHLPQKESCA